MVTLTILFDNESGFESLYWVITESKWLISRVLGKPALGIVACYWLRLSRVVMRGTKVGIIGKKSPEKHPENVVTFVLVTCGLHVGMMLELWPLQNLLLAHYWLHAGLALMYPVPGCSPWVPIGIVQV